MIHVFTNSILADAASCKINTSSEFKMLNCIYRPVQKQQEKQMQQNLQITSDGLPALNRSC